MKLSMCGLFMVGQAQGIPIRDGTCIELSIGIGKKGSGCSTNNHP